MKNAQLLRTISIVIGCLALLAFLISGALLHWAWAGFDKPHYDWMQLLIIPVVLALVAVWFNRIDKKNELAIAQKRADDEQARNLDNQRESALQGYFDRMSELVLKENLDTSQLDSKVRTIARARTLTVLPLLDAPRKSSIIQFLSESALLEIINLSGADLRGASLIAADLRGATLIRANFSGTELIAANLLTANLFAASLNGADLSFATLNGADLSFANLSDASLNGANLSVANLSEANLSVADLRGANLNGADLRGANLNGADLRGAKINQFSLDNATVTKEQRAGLTLVTP